MTGRRASPLFYPLQLGREDKECDPIKNTQPALTRQTFAISLLECKKPPERYLNIPRALLS